MNPSNETTPSSPCARILRASLASAALATVISLTSGCVVAVRPAPPPPPVAEAYTSPEEVVVTQEPPQPYTEVIGVAPGPGFFWVGGYWHWYGNRWVWYRGHYARPPHPGAFWVGPRYVLRGGARIYVRGYWRP